MAQQNDSTGIGYGRRHAVNSLLNTTGSTATSVKELCA